MKARGASRRTRYAVEWRYPGGKVWRRWKSFAGQNQAEDAYAGIVFIAKDREWRMRPVTGKTKSKLTAPQRELRRQRSLKRDRWAAARAECVSRDLGQCQKCGGPGAEVHHIIGRRRLRLRFEPDNLLLMCCACHDWYEAHKLTAHDWFRRHWPERHARLMMIEQGFGSIVDKIAVHEIRHGGELSGAE